MSRRKEGEERKGIRVEYLENQPPITNNKNKYPGIFEYLIKALVLSHSEYALRA
jgi:hypothetical protein